MPLPRPGPAAPHAETSTEVVRSLASDERRGLTSSEAAHRLSTDGPNELDEGSTTGWLARVAEQLANPLVVLLLVAMVISLIAWQLDGDDAVPFDAIAIGVIVVLNAAIGAIQQHRAEAAVAALAEMAAAEATVVRDGVRARVPARDVVRGDVLVLEAGAAVAADARLVECRALAVAEASLTGESMPVDKQIEPVPHDAALADRTSMVYAGTAAVDGNATGVVTSTGMDTEIGAIATLLQATESEPTPLERELSFIGRWLGLGVVAIAAVVAVTITVVSDIETSRDLIDVALIGVSLAVAAVPEGLPAVLSVVLAIGVQRMAARNALVKRLASAETLGAATVICTDKTGTLTRNEMTVRSVVTAEGRSEDLHRPEAVDVLRAMAVAGNATASAGDSGIEIVGEPTEAAMVRAVMDSGFAPDELDTRRRIDELPFSSDRKRMTVLVTGDGDGDDRTGMQVLTKGAPEVVLQRCTRESTRSGVVELSEERRRWWQQQVDGLADEAMRTLAVASGSTDDDHLTDASEDGLVVLGVVGVMDPPRSEVVASMSATGRAGIRVLMVTGDHPKTAAAIAREIGIADRETPVVTGPDIDRLDDDGLADAAARSAVFARVAPAHKLRLVEALRSRGEVVAMTGDGVNDAPALKAADIGTAMGVTGTDVAREAADMVLTDDDFTTIVAAVEEGRGIFHNIRSFLRYLLSSNVGEVLTVFLGVVLAGVLGLKSDAEAIIAPLTATQILWINLLTDTGPALALGVDPVDPRLMRAPPRRHDDHAVDAVMQRGIALIGLTMAAATLLVFDAHRPGGLIDGSSDIETARTAAFTVLVLAQLFNCFNARSDEVSAFHRMVANRWLLVTVALSFALQFVVVYVPVMQDAFSTAPLSFDQWVWAAVAASSVLWVSEVRKLARRAASRRHSNTTKNPA